MRLVAYDLTTTVQQQITVGSKNLNVGALRPYLLVVGSPAGSVLMQIQDTSGRVIASSSAVALSTIAALGAGAWHGFYKFPIAAALKAGTVYNIVLKGSGYTFAGGAYVSWCNSYEFKNAFTASYTAASGQGAPLGLQVWCYKFVNKGDA